MKYFLYPFILVLAFSCNTAVIANTQNLEVKPEVDQVEVNNFDAKTRFEKAWQYVADNFPDKNYNGVDWPKMKEKYESDAFKCRSEVERR